jgi:hypothetical protein
MNHYQGIRNTSAPKGGQEHLGSYRSRPQFKKRHYHLQAALGMTLVLLMPLLLIYVLLSVSHIDTAALDVVNATAPFYLIAVLLLQVYQTIRREPAATWTPLMWFPLASVAFFGVGPLSEFYSNETTQYILSTYRLKVSSIELLNSNMMSTIGIFGVTLGLYAYTRLWPTDWIVSGRYKSWLPSPVVSAKMVALMAVFIGGALKYLLINPAAWLQLNIQIPGVLTTISPLVDVGFGLVAFLAARGHRSMTVLFWTLWPAHLVITSLSFAKTEILLALLMPIIGAYQGNRRFGQIIVSLLAVVLVYISAQHFVSYGRIELIKTVGNHYEAGYNQRIAITKGYFSGAKQSYRAHDDRQEWWIRLNYTGPQAIAKKLYDQGVRPNTLKGFWMHFMPRAIWREKPELIGPGREFTTIVTGRYENTYTGLSIYGDMYWQLGWWGVILIAPLVGLLYGWITTHSLFILRRRNFIFMPIVLIGIQMSSTGPSGYLISIIGAIPIYLAYLYGMQLIMRFFARRPRNTRLVVGKLQYQGKLHR